MNKKTLVVIGGGAAGFFCAVNSARMDKNLRVIILEKTNKLLAKVKISGGGRCNVTHACFELKEMSKRYPRGENFVRKAFHQFFTSDTIKWFEERGVKLKTEEDGRMFPVTNTSQTIISCLMNEVNKYGLEIRMNTEVKQLRKKDAHFEIITANGSLTNADYVCVACGGFPKRSMFQWLENTGHTISEPVPSLFTFNLPKHAITELMGVSVESVKVKVEGTRLSEDGPLLITHWGLSGPVILRLSAWGARELAIKNYAFKIHVNWLPAHNEADLRTYLNNQRITYPSKRFSSLSFSELPNRLWQFLLDQSEISADTRFADLPSRLENLLIKNLFDQVFEIKGKTTFKEEFVTAGGIALNEINVNTMMSKKWENLFFAGEVTDVDGITGGYNFQYAWTSGWIAAKAICAIPS